MSKIVLILLLGLTTLCGIRIDKPNSMISDAGVADDFNESEHWEQLIIDWADLEVSSSSSSSFAGSLSFRLGADQKISLEEFVSKLREKAIRELDRKFDDVETRDCGSKSEKSEKTTLRFVCRRKDKLCVCFVTVEKQIVDPLLEISWQFAFTER